MTRLQVGLGTRWTLTEFGQGDQQQRTFDLPLREMIVGRGADVDFTIPSNSVSKRHARLTFKTDHMIVEDLNSTNGTHVNGAPVKCSTAVEGDLLQFANAVFRVGRAAESQGERTIEESLLPWVHTLILFDQLLTERAVIPHFQPIVTLDHQETTAFELLARSELNGLNHPALMFGVAERLGEEAALSELMRDEGMKVASDSRQAGSEFFLNTHPCEVLNDRLIASLNDLRAKHPKLRIAIEIHEAAVTDPASMKRFRSILRGLHMRLSYDDFGAGQGRLLELGEVPPDILKFDMQLIRSIDTASATRQELLASLVRLSIELGTTPLAEGVETQAEHDVCRQMGFQLGQGFLYGRPVRLA